MIKTTNFVAIIFIVKKEFDVVESFACEVFLTS